jgi:acyl-[acyl-carrier-protein]-phospholipid O-acyltransferase / long-chain-fatty-acid--[acyl-carrier-protein] ligase
MCQDNGGRVKTSNQKDKPISRSEARKKLAAMAACYFLGTFNDNFFKQAVFTLAVRSDLINNQGHAVEAFTAPFILFAAYAGWLSDKFAKRRIVIAAKWIELIAMVAGGIGIVTGSWIMIYTMLFIMGTQATIFSPAINGSIPELYSGNDVVKANGIFRMVVMIAILLGMGLSGPVYSLQGLMIFDIPKGRIAISLIIIVLALIGVIMSYAVYSRDAAAPKKPFPWFGPLNTLKVLFDIRLDKLLSIVILLDVFIWFAGSVQIQLLNPLGLKQYGFNEIKTGLLIVSQLIGIGVGGLLSSKFTKGERWYRILIPAGFGMSLCMGIISQVPSISMPLGEVVLFAAVGGVGVFGGLFMIPLESFIQIRPAAKNKGTVWASANFLIFLGILLSGPAGNLLNSIFKPTSGYGYLGIFSFVISILVVFLFRKGDHK